jgi:hypothetical protein
MNRLQILPFLLFYIFQFSFVNAQQEIPVNMYTGTPIINIPIGVVSDYDLQQPIALSYNANGLKVGEKSDDLGVGWTLVSGGSVTREVRSFPDDIRGPSSSQRKGWLYQNAAGTGVAADIAAFNPTADLFINHMYGRTSRPYENQFLLDRANRY